MLLGSPFLRRNMEHKREDKLGARDITSVRTPAAARPEKEHGKLYRWFDNFWYHHKWATIATLFIVVVLTVCILQMCTREEAGDITVVTAGPYGFVTDEATLTNLRNCLATYLASDYNGNGVKDVSIHSYTVYSESEAKAFEAMTDENGQSLGNSVDRSQNTKEYTSFTQYIQTGDAAVLFLSPWLASELGGSGSALVNFSDLLGYTPENGVISVREDGSAVCYGIALKETALWRENGAIRQALPENTVICLMAPGLLGDNGDEDTYNRSVAFVKEIIK